MRPCTIQCAAAKRAGLAHGLRPSSVLGLETLIDMHPARMKASLHHHLIELRPSAFNTEHIDTYLSCCLVASSGV